MIIDAENLNHIVTFDDQNEVVQVEFRVDFLLVIFCYFLY